MNKPTVTAAQIVHIGTAMEKAANEVGLKLYDFATGCLIMPNPALNIILDGEQKEIEVCSYTFILESLDE